MSSYFTFNKDQISDLRMVYCAYENNLSEHAFQSNYAVREFETRQKGSEFRTPFMIDCDKIVHSLYYNRYADKTQVFSFYKNDDITRRALHVQLVSRIARTIGRALQLNLDLIEAIALGHDMGHTPFGHKGEEYLNELYFENTKKLFKHNVHSVRVLKSILRCNLTLQTLDGILCHNGEKAFLKYEPSQAKSISEFEEILSKCYTDNNETNKLRPATLEGCVVRISDMLAYIGKDRQDARKANFDISGLYCGKYLSEGKSSVNASIISKAIANIIKNSLHKPYLSMDKEIFEEIKELQEANFSAIYMDSRLSQPYEEIIKPMMRAMYYRLMSDYSKGKFDSPIYIHYLNSNLGKVYRCEKTRKIIVDKNEIVTDYIASMTDDYFLDLYQILFPEDSLIGKIEIVGYFEQGIQHS